MIACTDCVVTWGYGNRHIQRDITLRSRGILDNPRRDWDGIAWLDLDMPLLTTQLDKGFWQDDEKVQISFLRLTSEVAIALVSADSTIVRIKDRLTSNMGRRWLEGWSEQTVKIYITNNEVLSYN